MFFIHLHEQTIGCSAVKVTGKRDALERHQLICKYLCHFTLPSVISPFPLSPSQLKKLCLLKLTASLEDQPFQIVHEGGTIYSFMNVMTMNQKHFPVSYGNSELSPMDKWKQEPSSSPFPGPKNKVLIGIKHSSGWTGTSAR